MLPKLSVTDAARSCARIFRTPRKVIRTDRDGYTSQDVNSSKANTRLNPPIPSSNPNSISPAYTETQDISNPRRSFIAIRARSTEALGAPINGFSAVNGHSTYLFSKLIGVETVPGESANVNLRGGMDFASNSVLGEIPNLVDLGLSPANAADKIKSVFVPATRVEGLTDNSDWLVSRHGCKKVTVGRVSEAKAYSDYI